MITTRLLRGLGHGARHSEGTVLPLVALMIVVLVGFAAFAVDWGQLHEERRQLQNTADAAALAGARELDPSDSDQAARRTAAERLATSYVEFNGVTEAPTISVSCTFACPEFDTITVNIGRNVTTFLAGVIGTASAAVSAQATGIKGSLGTPNGCVLPLAALAGAPSWPAVGSNPPFTYYTEDNPKVFTLKQDAGGRWGTGNFGGVDLYSDIHPEGNYFDVLGGTCPEFSAPTKGEFYPKQNGEFGRNGLNILENRTAAEPRPWVDLGAYATWSDSLSRYVPNSGQEWTDVSTRFAYVPIFNYDEWQACSGTCSSGVELQGFAMFFLTILGCEDDDSGNRTWAWEAPRDGEGKCAPGNSGVVEGGFIEAGDTIGSFAEWNNFGAQVARLWR